MKIAAEHLSAAYGRHVAVDDVSFEVASGEMVAVVGPNGSGKSTLLRALGRLHAPKKGRVLLDGRDIRSMPSREVARNVAILPQVHGEAPDLTVRELAWRGRHPHQGLLGRARLLDFEVVQRVLHQADLQDIAERPLGGLSGGERQRAWIGLALAQEPKVLLLDEPTSFLDLRHQVEVMELLRTLNQRQGLTVVTVLHDLALAARYASRMIVLDGGRVASQGSPASVCTVEALEPVFGVPLVMLRDPDSGLPLPFPRFRSGATA